MRMILGLFAAAALVGMSACNDESPNDVPRTVPPASDNGSISTTPAVHGVGPTIEAAAKSGETA
jgi:hypothetical protein